MSVSIALVCEGNSDPPAICALADRIISENTWVPQDEIATHRHYRGFRPESPYLAWQDIDALAASKGVKSMGHFQGMPLHRDGHAARKAIILLTLRKVQVQPVDAIIFFRDGDRQYPERCTAIRLVRDSMPLTIPVVVGIANRMRECWLLNGFTPQDDEERARLESEAKSVQFDPVLRAHDLTSRDVSDVRHPKRVLAALTNCDPDRELHGIAHLSMDTLRNRGTESGLSDFIVELQSRLINAFQ